MLFNSLEFLIFFPIVVALYFALPNRFRWVLLLLASYYFYMCWNYKYVVLILLTTTVNYFAGLGISSVKRHGLKVFFLTLGLLVSFSTLIFYKYFNFFSSSLNDLFAQFNMFSELPTYNILLPVGISFFTFQTLSYTLDVYFGKQKVEKHFGIFALYVSFFPQLVAGPIERSTNLLPQFYKENHLLYKNVREGISFMLLGFFMKVVIADRLSEYVNLVYNNPAGYPGQHLLLATFFFTFQIYCDFAGYSYIAIGTAQVMGYNLMTNFRRPYFAMNIREFWQRWHISLSTWFRDYLYIPLGGNRVSKWRRFFNLFFTFLVSGLWHGANWTFVIWGALHGFYHLFAIWISTFREKVNLFIGLTKIPKVHNILQRLVTFLLATFAWIFFRSMSIHDALFIIKNLFKFDSGIKLNLFYFPVDFYIAFIIIGILLIVEILEERIGLWDRIQKAPKIYKWVLFAGISLSILILGKWEDIDFLYFQF